MALKGQIAQFLIKLGVYSLGLAGIVYAAIHAEYLNLSIQAALAMWLYWQYRLYRQYREY